MVESLESGAARLRQLRANNPGWSTAKNAVWESANREKRAAHKRVEAAVRVGTLVREPCERCGSTTLVHAHHDDYSKPLAVKWLCPSHHRERHRELASEAREWASDVRLDDSSLNCAGGADLRRRLFSKMEI